jgi:hypothetical protein
MQTIWQKSFEGKNNHYFTIEIVKIEPGAFNINLTEANLKDGNVLSKMTFSKEDLDKLYSLLGEAFAQILGNKDATPAESHLYSEVLSQLRELRLNAERVAYLRNISFRLSKDAPAAEQNSQDDILREIDELTQYINRHDVDYYKAFVKDMISVAHHINKSSSMPPTDAEVLIYVADPEVDHLNAEAITNSAGEFMEALGYELKSEDEPVYGSWWKRIQFVLNKQVSVDELDRAISKGKKALELKHVELPTAEQTEKLASASKSIIESLEGFNEAVVRLGAILVLKRTVNGEPKLIVQQLSSELITLLDKKPQLLKSPQTIYELITGDVQGEDDADDSTTMVGTAVLPEE